MIHKNFFFTRPDKYTPVHFLCYPSIRRVDGSLHKCMAVAHLRCAIVLNYYPVCTCQTAANLCHHSLLVVAIFHKLYVSSEICSYTQHRPTSNLVAVVTVHYLQIVETKKGKGAYQTHLPSMHAAMQVPGQLKSVVRKVAVDLE